MKLSDHFTYDELCFSQEAARRGWTNGPNSTELENLRALCHDILEPLRNSIGRPIFVSSGYRSPAINRAVGGAKNSDHMCGLAADITAPPLSVDALADAVRTLAPYVPLHQCIREFGKWIHVSRLPPERDFDADDKPEFLIATLVNREVKYSPWNA